MVKDKKESGSLEQTALRRAAVLHYNSAKSELNNARRKRARSYSVQLALGPLLTLAPSSGSATKTLAHAGGAHKPFSVHQCWFSYNGHLIENRSWHSRSASCLRS